MAYAENTSVPVDRSKAEIEKILMKYGASDFAYMVRLDKAAIAFVAHGKHIRFILPLPDSNDKEFLKTPTGRSRKTSSLSNACEQEVRRRWRALALGIKAKLEFVNSGISVFEQEFLSQIVLPTGKTVAEEVMPAVEQACQTGKMPVLLPGY